jgi:transposase
MSSREKPNLSYWKIFNHILFVLHTGIQWQNLPIKGCHFTNIYRHHNRWSKDGSYEKIFNGSLDYLKQKKKLNLSALHGDGSNVVAKKGARR